MKILDLPKNIAKLMIRVYQRLFSFDHAFWANPNVFRVCVHYPSCSEYAYEAIDRFGVIKGGLLASWRVLRCNPFTKNRIDPVPNDLSVDKAGK